MRIEIHHYHHYPEIEKMSQQMDDLKNDFEQLKGAVGAVLDRVNALPQMVADAVAAAQNGDNAALAALDADVKSEVDTINAALAPVGVTPTNPADTTPLPPA